MSFKYINPGYVKMLADYDNAKVQQIEADSDTSKTGIGIAAVERTSDVTYNLIEISDISINELWLKFDVYIPPFGSSKGCRFTITFPKGSPSIEFVTDDDEWVNYITVYIGDGDSTEDLPTIYDTNTDTIKEELGLKVGALNTILIHSVQNLNSNYQSGRIELNINGKKIYTLEHTSESQEYNKWGTSSAINIMDNTYSDRIPIFSNIIISDKEININEKIVPLIVSETKTTMSTTSGGLYVADKVGQTFFQSANTAAMADIYGDDSPVTGILVVGNPAYTDSGTETLVSVSRVDGIMTEYYAANVTTGTESMVFSSWIADSDMTISDLNGMEFGWKASG